MDLRLPADWQPQLSPEQEIDILEEVRRLRVQLWWTQKVLMQIVVPALLEEAP